MCAVDDQCPDNMICVSPFCRDPCATGLKDCLSCACTTTNHVPVCAECCGDGICNNGETCGECFDCDCETDRKTCQEAVDSAVSVAYECYECMTDSDCAGKTGEGGTAYICTYTACVDPCVEGRYSYKLFSKVVPNQINTILNSTAGVNITQYAVESSQGWFQTAETAALSCAKRCESDINCDCFAVLLNFDDEKWYCFADDMGGLGSLSCGNFSG